MAEKYYDSTLTGEELDEALLGIPENMRRSEAAAKAAESWAQGGTGTRDGEDEDNAEYWAGQAQTNAETAADATQVVKENISAIKAIEENIGTIQKAPEAAERAETAAAKAEGDATRAETAADAAASSQSAAEQSAESAAGSVEVLRDNEEAIQAVQINLEAILTAADNALAAQGAAEDAAASAETAKEAADRAQSISQGALGYYAKAENLRSDHETGENGQWAIVGETDTIWVWDGDGGEWTDSGNKTDLSQYYTKDQADQKNNELQQAMNKAFTAALEELRGEVDTRLETQRQTLAEAIGTAQSTAEAAQQAAEAALPRAGGTMAGDINTDGHRVTGLAVPTEETDAATKQYVDSRVTFRFDPDSGTLTITAAAEVEV